MIPYIQIISYFRNVCEDNIDVFLCVICDICLYNVMWYTGNKEIIKQKKSKSQTKSQAKVQRPVHVLHYAPKTRTNISSVRLSAKPNMYDIWKSNAAFYIATQTQCQVVVHCAFSYIFFPNMYLVPNTDKQGAILILRQCDYLLQICNVSA
jgi:hypothetical protein